MLDENQEPLITEMLRIFSNEKAVARLLGRNLKWHAENFFPQYFILLDNLNVPELIQPDIDINKIFRIIGITIRLIINNENFKLQQTFFQTY